MKTDLRPYNWHTNNTKFDSWFERDRAMVRITDNRDNEIMCLWDSEVSEFVVDGFKSNRQDWHSALCDYATERKLRAVYK